MALVLTGRDFDSRAKIAPRFNGFTPRESQPHETPGEAKCARRNLTLAAVDKISASVSHPPTLFPSLSLSLSYHPFLSLSPSPPLPLFVSFAHCGGLWFP